MVKVLYYIMLLLILFIWELLLLFLVIGMSGRAALRAVEIPQHAHRAQSLRLHLYCVEFYIVVVVVVIISYSVPDQNHRIATPIRWRCRIEIRLHQIYPMAPPIACRPTTTTHVTPGVGYFRPSRFLCWQPRIPPPLQRRQPSTAAKRARNRRRQMWQRKG